jgi:hypothetical protein
VENVLFYRPATLRTVSSVALCYQSHLAPLQRCHCTVAASPYVLQILTVLSAHTSCRSIMILTSDTFGTCAHVLGTSEPGCVRAGLLAFFMLEAHGSQGPHGTCGSIRVHLSREMKSGDKEHVTASKPSSVGRRGPKVVGHVRAPDPTSVERRSPEP